MAQTGPAVERALAYLAKNQNSDGAFGPASDPERRIAVTSVSLLAFISAGQAPDLGKFGSTVRAATDYLIQSAQSKMSPRTHATLLCALGEVAGIDDSATDQTRLTKLCGSSAADPKIVPFTGSLSSMLQTLHALCTNNEPTDSVSCSMLYRAAVVATRFHIDELTQRINALLLPRQRPDGSWNDDAELTAFAVLALTAPERLMPLNFGDVNANPGLEAVQKPQ